MFDLYKEELPPIRKKWTYAKRFAYWREYLGEKCIRMFKWDGLPFPQKELELRLILIGWAPVYRSAKTGVSTSFGSMTDQTEYADEFKKLTYTNSQDSGMRDIGQNCIIVDANQMRVPLIHLIDSYAHMLAHADLSLQAVAINTRSTGLIAVENEKQAQQVKEWYGALENGSTMAIVEKNSLESTVHAPGMRQVAASYPQSVNIKDFHDLKNQLLQSFYHDIGVRTAPDKKERLITEEVQDNDRMLLINIGDMLDSRQKAADAINAMFGLNVTVELAPGYVSEEEVEEVEDEEDIERPAE